MTDNAEAAELEPSEELLAARALETGLVEEDETYIYTLMTFRTRTWPLITCGYRRELVGRST